MKWLRSFTAVILILLLIEFLDEFVFGARQAAWPLIRDDLRLNYLQVGLVLSVPGVVSGILEPFIGILGDVWRRRTLILGGGVLYALALFLVAVSQGFGWLLLAFALLYPASGAFVSLSQAALMDAEPDRHEQNMARWTFAGSVGIVLGPLVLVGTLSLGRNWRVLFGLLAVITVVTLLFAWRSAALNGGGISADDSLAPLTLSTFWGGIRGALGALRRGEVLRWLVMLQFADLMLDILHGYLALYFVDVVGVTNSQAALGVAVWTGAGLVSDFMLIPLLERIAGLKYLRLSALLVLFIFPTFLLVQTWPLKLVIVGILGILNAGWYAIPKGQLYSVLPGQSGSVMMLTNLFGFVGALIPLGLGWLAMHWGMEIAIWFIILGPITLLLGIPRNR